MRRKIAGVTFVSAGGELEQLLAGDGSTFLVSTLRDSSDGLPAYASFKSAKAFAEDFRDGACAVAEAGRYWQFSEVVKRAAPSRLAFALQFNETCGSLFKEVLGAALAAVNKYLEAEVGTVCTVEDCSFSRYTDKCIDIWRVVVRSAGSQPVALANQPARDAALAAIRSHLLAGNKFTERLVHLDVFYSQDSSVPLVWSNDALEQGWVLRTLSVAHVAAYMQTGTPPPRPVGRMTSALIIDHAVTCVPAEAKLIYASVDGGPAEARRPVELSAEDSAVVASAERAGINVAALRVTDVRTTDSGKKIYARQTAGFVCPAGVCHGGGEAVLVLKRGHVRFLCMGPPRGCADDLRELVRGKAVVRDGDGEEGEAVEARVPRTASRTGHEGACCDVHCGPLAEHLFGSAVVLREGVPDPLTSIPRYCPPPTVSERAAIGVDPHNCILVYDDNCATGKSTAAIAAAVEHVQLARAAGRTPNVIYIASHVGLVTALANKLTAAFAKAGLSDVPWHDYVTHRDQPDLLRTGCRVGCAMSIAKLWAPDDDAEPAFVIGDEFAATLRMMPTLGTYALPLLRALFRKAEVALILDASAGSSIREFLEHAGVPESSTRWVRTDVDSIFKNQTHRIVVPYRLNKDGGPKLERADSFLHIARLLDSGKHVSVSCGKKFGAIVQTALDKLGFKSLFLHGKLDGTEKKKLMTLFEKLKRDDGSGVRAFLFTPALVGGAESWGMFDVHVDVLTLTTPALDWPQRVARVRDAAAVDTLVADKRLLWAMLPKFDVVRVERDDVYSDPDIQQLVNARTVMGAPIPKKGIAALQLASLCGTGVPVSSPVPACDAWYVQSARAIYQLRPREPPPLYSLDDVRNASNHVGRATAAATRLNSGTVEKLSVAALARAVRRSAFDTTASGKDLAFERLIYGPKVDEANRAATLFMDIGQIAERIGVEVEVHAVNMFADLTPRDKQLINCFAFAKQSYNRKECLQIARFALDKFLPFTSEKEDALYESADKRWDAMLALWQKRELPAPPPPPKKRSRRAEPVGGRAGGGGGAAPAPAAVAVAGSAHEEEEDDEDCDDLDMGDSDYESADDENDETVADKHDGWQKTLWEMCLSFGHEAVRDLATRIIAYESVCALHLEDAAESGGLNPEQLRQLVDEGHDVDDILVGGKLLPNEAWELVTNQAFAQTFEALAKLKCGARAGRKAAERDAMTQRFMFKAKDKDPELRVVFLDNLLEALGFADGVFDLGQIESLGDLRADEKADARRIQVANAAASAYLGSVERRVVSAHDKQLMRKVVGAVKTLDICKAELTSRGRGAEKRFHLERSPVVEHYLSESFAASENDEPGASWRTLRRKDFFRAVYGSSAAEASAAERPRVAAAADERADERKQLALKIQERFNFCRTEASFYTPLLKEVALKTGKWSAVHERYGTFNWTLEAQGHLKDTSCVAKFRISVPSNRDSTLELTVTSEDKVYLSTYCGAPEDVTSVFTFSSIEAAEAHAAAIEKLGRGKM